MIRTKQKLEKRALTINKKQYVRDFISVANILVLLGKVFRIVGYHQPAYEVLQRSLPISEKQYARDHIIVAVILESLCIDYGVLDD